MKTEKKISLILVLLAFFSVISLISQGDYQIANFTVNDYLGYTVISSSNSTNAFFGAWPPGHYFGDWNVTIGDTVWFNITSITNTEINGTLVLGDSIFSNVRNIDVASALAFSIYPWLGGFIANASDWSTIEQTIEGTNTTVTVEENFEIIINSNHRLTTVRKFVVNNYYGQYSELIYDNNTGVLIKGYSSFGGYSLGVEIDKTSIEIGKEKTKSLIYTPMVGVLAFLLLIKTRIKRRKITPLN
ncbi:MAG: hypothetical protein ACTSQE_09760 [Candidatus Heimdallarchaeaceae archaeon]